MVKASGAAKEKRAGPIAIIGAGVLYGGLFVTMITRIMINSAR